MPTFEIETPEGEVYEIEGDNAQGAYEAFQKFLGKSQPTMEDFESGAMFGGTIGPRKEKPLPEEVESDNVWGFDLGDRPDSVRFPLGPELLTNAVGGIIDSLGREIPATALSIRDMFTGSDDAQEFMETVPDFEPTDGMFGTLVSEGAGLLSGAGAGAKAVSKIPQISKNLPKLQKWLKTVFAGEAGGVAAADPDLEGFLIGENGRLLEGMAIDENGEFSEQLLTKKLNLLADAVLFLKTGELAARGVTGGTKFALENIIKPFFNLVDKDEIGKTAVKEVLNSTAGVRLDDTPAEEFRKNQTIIDAVEKNKDFITPSGIDDVPDISMQRDTLSAAERGLGNSLEESRMRSRIRGYKEGARGKSTPELESTLAQPSLQTEKFLGTVEDVSGGPEAMETARTNIQQSVLDETDAMMNEVQRAQNKAIQSEEDVKVLITEDPTFGEILSSLDDVVDINLSGKSINKANEIINFVNEASEEMTKIKKGLYDAIPSGVEVDETMLNTSINNAREYLSDKDLKILEEAGADFKLINQYASFELQDAINAAARSGDWDKVDALQAFKKEITDDQLNKLFIAGGDSREAVEAVDRAKEYFINQYAPFWRDGRLQEIQKLGYKHKLQPDNKAVFQRDTLVEALNNPEHPEFTKKIIQLLDTDEGKKSSGLVLDYALGKIASEVQQIINKGKLSPDDISHFSNKLNTFVPIFEEIDPKQVPRLNNFLTKLRDDTLSIKDLKGVVDNLVQKQKEVEDELFTRFKPFFDEQRIPNTNTDNVLGTVFKDPEVLRKLPEITKRSGDTKGLRAAYSKFFKDQIFRSKEGSAGEKLLNPLSDDELERLYKIGDELFKENPEIMDTIRKLGDEVFTTEKTKTGKKAPTMDSSGFRKAATQTVDFLVTMIRGPLDTIGSRLRAAGGRIVRSADPKDTASAIMDTILSNPDEFLRLAKKVQGDVSKLTTKDKRNLYKMIIGTGYYGTAGQPDKELEQEFIDSFESSEDQQMRDQFGSIPEEGTQFADAQDYVYGEDAPTIFDAMQAEREGLIMVPNPDDNDGKEDRLPLPPPSEGRLSDERFFGTPEITTDDLSQFKELMRKGDTKALEELFDNLGLTFNPNAGSRERSGFFEGTGGTMISRSRKKKKKRKFGDFTGGPQYPQE